MPADDRDGQIGLEEGKFKVIDPEEGGKRAVLYPPEEGGVMYRNGVEVDGPVQCGFEDVIILEPTTYMEEARIEVKISPDGLYAMAAVHPRLLITYQLKDAPLAASLKPQLEKVEKREPLITLEKAEQEIRKNNIVVNLDMATLNELVKDADGDFKTVARGKAMEEGKEGRLEYIIDPQVEVISYEDESGRADYREKFRYPAVKKGDLIAILHPPVEGKPGQRVTGEAIVPKPVKGSKVRCGEGAILADNKKDIFAEKDGRLMVKGSNIKVVNLLVHNGDVNMESGNIRFNGDVRIFGNVMEGMLVETSGALVVDNNCYGATLKAGGGIQVNKNVVKSDVQGGVFYGLLREILIIVGQLVEELDGYIENLKQVFKGLAEKGQKIDDEYIKRIVKMLLEKSSGLEDSMALLEQKLSPTQHSYLDETKQVLKDLQDFFTLSMDKCDPDLLVKLLKKLRTLVEGYYQELSDLPPLTVSYIQNSKIKHSGDIEVIGPGSYFSILQAGGEVRIQGVCRGGSIQAEGNVKVKEFIHIATAAEKGDKQSSIRIKVPAQSAIYFTLAHEDTTVQVGKMVYRFEQDYSNIKVSYDPEEAMLKLTNI